MQLRRKRMKYLAAGQYVPTIHLYLYVGVRRSRWDGDQVEGEDSGAAGSGLQRGGMPEHRLILRD